MNLARVRRLALILGCAALLAACATVQGDLAVERLPENAFAVLDGYERELVLLEAEPNPEALSRLKNRMIEARPILDRAYTARLAALSGRAALLAGDRTLAERELKKALADNPADEVARVLELRLERNTKKQRVLLDSALRTAETQNRLKAEMGRLLLAEGRYADALAAFDASLPFLPDAYSQAFGTERRRALALKDSSAPAGGASYLTDKPLSLEGMAALTQGESALVDFLTGGRTWATGVLFDRLRAGGFYAEPAAGASVIVRRGDAAYFLWQLVANRKGDKSLLRKYSERYWSRPNPTSPVPDVPLEAPWFDSALGCVERGIMDLPDGRLFYPHDYVTGLEFYRWLKKAEDL